MRYWVDSWTDKDTLYINGRGIVLLLLFVLVVYVTLVKIEFVHYLFMVEGLDGEISVGRGLPIIHCVCSIIPVR